jgi:signal transduction histidine kinase
MTSSFGNATTAEAAPVSRVRQRWVATLRAHISSVRWRWILLVGALVPVLSLMSALLVSEGGPSIVRAVLSARKPSYQIGGICETVGAWGAPLLNVLLTVGAANWATRKIGRWAILHGALIGLVSTLVGVGVGSLFGLTFDFSDAVQDKWNLAMMILTLGGGGLGGIEGRATLTGQEALYRASRAIGAADSPQAIVAAIGEHLAGLKVSQVTLWRVVPQPEDDAPTEIVLLAAWAPQGARAPPPGLRLGVAGLHQKMPVLLRVDELSASERAIWERLGVRSVLLLPLTTSKDALAGVLMVASHKAGRFKRGIWHTQLIGAQVALALENLRLVEQARQAAVLEERQRLAREIHDTLAQGFTSIVMHLEAAEQSLPGEVATVQQHLDQARRTARESLGQARRLVWALRPERLERASLPEALARVIAQWEEESGIVADVTTTGTAFPLHPEVEVTLLRATQEALTNVRKHAQASQVTVTLSYMGDMVVLDVQDDGLGFDPMRIRTPPAAQATGGFGLTAMRERAEQLGGTLLVESGPGQGTTLVVEIPTPAGEQMDWQATGMAAETYKERRE